MEPDVTAIIATLKSVSPVMRADRHSQFIVPNWREMAAAMLPLLADARRQAVEEILPRGWYIEARVYPASCDGVAGNHRTCGCVRFVVDQRGMGLTPEARYTNDEANAYFRALLPPAPRSGP